MDFEGFLADCRAEWREFDDDAALARAPHPRDRALRPLLAAIPGMATENKLVLLNRAVARLAPGEVYVEIGCWQGLSLAGAVFGHGTAPAYACDDFSEFGGPRAALLDTLEHWTAPGQVRFYDRDFRRFLAEAPWAPAPVGVYFYDGAHDFDDQFIALQAMLPHLAADAAVIVDDTNWRHVRAANHLVAQCAPGLELVRDLRTSSAFAPTWWNGLQLYRWRGTPGTVLATPGDYARRRFAWDGVYLPIMRMAWRARAALGRVPGARRAWRRLRRS